MLRLRKAMISDAKKEAIESEIADTLILKGDYYEVESSFDQTEVFDIGFECGKYLTEQKLNAPEEFDMSNESAELLQEAISMYQKESYITVNSISVIPSGDKIKTVKIKPTSAVHFFNIVLRYGKLCRDKEIAQQHTEKA